MATLDVQTDKGVCTVSLARPKVRNAFNDELINDLQDTFERLAQDPAVRVIVLRGQGPVFCAGGDLKWLQRSIDLSPDENLADTRRLAFMFATLNDCPKPLVGLVHGAAIGGGVGLVSVCDYVICSQDTKFSLSEVRLGIIPACIAPFALAKIGASHARSYFISAQRFDARRAYEIGLVHELVAGPAELDGAAHKLTSDLLQCGPHAMAAAKKLLKQLQTTDDVGGLDLAAHTLADLRVAPEGQEGLRAYLEKRPPAWLQT